MHLSTGEPVAEMKGLVTKPEKEKIAENKKDFPDYIEIAEKGEASIYVKMGIWYNETGRIHLTVPDSGWFHTTVDDDPAGRRGHPNLFKKLARLLEEADRKPRPEIKD